nr:hypothetical protein [uncultured Acetatifactor sp.]
MKKIDTELLEILNDNDIKSIIAEIKLSDMLAPFKKDAKTYAKYIPRLGRLDTKSKMVKTNLPGIVYELYNKKDLNMRSLVSNQAQFLKNIIVEILEDYKAEELIPDSFSDMDSTKCVAILSDIENKNVKYWVDIDLFFLQLKLNAVEIPEQQKNEIKRLWSEQKEKEAVEKKRKQELEDALKAVEDSCKNEITALRNDYGSKINAAEEAIKGLHAIILKQQVNFDNLASNVEAHKKEMLVIAKMLNELNEKSKNQRLEFEQVWRKGVETNNQEFIRTREQVNSENRALQIQIDFLMEDRQKTEEEMKHIKDSISTTEDQLSILKNDIPNHSIECGEISPSVSQSSISEQSGGLRLFIEPGTSAIQKEVCGKYSQYVVAVETNLEMAGCRLSSGKLEDFFNAAVDIGLVPLLYGFGARKAAKALVAARYGEIPTMISIPIGYSDTVILSKEIDEARTTVVVIEDLFGRMNEDIILPVLRRDIVKQLVFCVERYECLKYVEPYFLNYVQLIKVDITSRRKIESFAFADATELFEDCRYSEKSDMHKKVKKLLKGIDISDVYIQSRGDMLTYLEEVIPHGTDAVFEEWFEHELLKILKPEQKKMVKERLLKDSLGISEEFIEKFDI